MKHGRWMFIPKRHVAHFVMVPDRGFGRSKCGVRSWRWRHLLRPGDRLGHYSRELFCKTCAVK